MKLNIGKLLGRAAKAVFKAAKPVAKAAAPLIVGAIAGAAQKKIGRVADRVVKKL